MKKGKVEDRSERRGGKGERMTGGIDKRGNEEEKKGKGREGERERRKRQPRTRRRRGTMCLEGCDGRFQSTITHTHLS